jgi:hypothetical protein
MATIVGLGLTALRHNQAMENRELAIAAAAARRMVDDGMEAGRAKRQALHDLNLPGRTPLPAHDTLLRAVREHIAIFCPQSQAQALQRLRHLALRWMLVMQDYAPHLTGAAWDGTATAKHDIYVQLFSDDPKAPEITLLNAGHRFQGGQGVGLRQPEVPVLTVYDTLPQALQPTAVHFIVNLHDALRGALRGRNQEGPARGSIDALRQRLDGALAGAAQP